MMQHLKGVDVDIQKDLYANTVLSGGTTIISVRHHPSTVKKQESNNIIPGAFVLLIAYT